MRNLANNLQCASDYQLPIFNYTDPLATKTIISLLIEEKAQLRIIDTNGKPACRWDGTDMAGREVQPGIYFVNLTLDNSIKQIQKILKN